VSDDVQRLFESAKLVGGLDFIFTLTRVEGMSFDHPDPLRKPAGSELKPEARAELLRMLGNLFRCAAGERYSGFVRPDDQEAHRRELAAAAHGGAYVAIAEALEAGGHALDRLLGDVLSAHERASLAFRSAARLHRLSDFTVLELLVDDVAGLNGFRAHFSNDEHAEFLRTESTTMPLNLSFDEDGSVVFMVGDLDALVSEWRIDGRPLYEVGLPGRYNKPGEWKPLVFPGDWDEYSRRATEASERPEVQGALLYMFLTGHHAVEFAVRTSVELSDEAMTFGGGRLELFRTSLSAGGDVVYDGTAYVEAPEPVRVEEALADVQALINRVAFAFDAAVTWAPKYTTVQRGGGHATPTNDDLQLLDHLLTAGGEVGRRFIDEALDWYNRGRSATNVFVAFLCSYISFESTALAVWNGDLSVALLERPAKSEWRAETRRCIEALHELTYADDPTAFVTQAYFECVAPVKRRVRRVATAVFGAESEAVMALFEDGDSPSLASLRGSLAHGRISLADHHAQELVRQRLPELQSIAREFLLRVGLETGPADPVPRWSGLHSLQIAMTDPRATLCTSSLQHLPQSDWTIRPEWIE
jgi:hypothetical protein